MKRLHLFEIEDQNWCPGIIRESITDFLFSLYKLLYLYEPAFQKIAELIIKTDSKKIVDCCSGSGGPILQLRDFLNTRELAAIQITLTDKFPNIEQFQNIEQHYDNICGWQQSIDACNIPANLTGIRCFFSSFHHFPPKQAIKILQNAVDNNTPIAIFESTQRHAIDFIRVLVSPILMLALIPFAKRLTWAKFFITYIVPITPLVFMWDYLVSNLRTYSRKEFEHLLKQVDAPNYTWEIGRLWSKKAKSSIPYLIGYPKIEEVRQGLAKQ